MTRFLLLMLVTFGTQSMFSTQAIMATNADQEVVIVHFGDSTCITGYLPNDQRVEAVLTHRLSDFYKHQKIVSHNVASGGDYNRQFLDRGRYKKIVKDKIPQIDIALAAPKIT